MAHWETSQSENEDWTGAVRSRPTRHKKNVFPDLDVRQTRDNGRLTHGVTRTDTFIPGSAKGSSAIGAMIGGAGLGGLATGSCAYLVLGTPAIMMAGGIGIILGGSLGYAYTKAKNSVVKYRGPPKHGGKRVTRKRRSMKR